METQPLDGMDDHAAGQTPEDVAILYSWANLEGAKYRDFSANRREYRAQMRHRAAEQLRLMELRAQSEAEAAAAEAEAEAAAAHAEADAASVKLAASRTSQTATAPATYEEEQVEHMRRSSLREAAQQARRAAAERLEAARRAEAAALADSIARREEREIAEAQASALRQAAQYADSEVRGRQKKTSPPENAVPGRISDPYGPQVVAEGEYFERPGTPVAELEASRFRQQREYIEHNTGVPLPPFRMPEAVVEIASAAGPAPRARGYRPDEPSGHLPTTATDESLTGHAPLDPPADFGPRRQAKPLFEERHLSIARDAHRLDEAGALQLRREQASVNAYQPFDAGPQRRVVVPSIPYKEFRRVTGDGSSTLTPEVVSRLANEAPGEESGTWRAAESMIGTGHSQLQGLQPRGVEDAPESWRGGLQGTDNAGGTAAPETNGNAPAGAVTRDSWGVAWERPDPRVADYGHVQEPVANRKPVWSNRPDGVRQDPPRSAAQPAADASGPAWLYPKPQLPRFVDSLVDSGGKRRAQLAANSLREASGKTQSQPSRDAEAQGPTRNHAAKPTLQQSREQVASRWFALKGVFAKADRNHTAEPRAAREQKRDTPFVVVYSLAGGVGKTSLVATLGRAFSAMGEKVLLTDTTSQGLLPFYFGASELRTGVVRTFSPPSGSADASIYMVGYDCAGHQAQAGKTESEAQADIFDDLLANSEHAHRVLIDLNVNCGWMAGRLAWVKPTILVPLAADMNSVISLRVVERIFNGLKDAEGKPLRPVYLLNQFDSSLPLHLDVREVLKQQLGDRLLPFVIRRAAGVSEALAEGMTIVDYDPGSEATQDYMGLANWLRSAVAPAAMGARNLRWSER